MNSQPLVTEEEALLLDRLVDGELSEAERRALIQRFEQQPHGWRQCALAFLEAQCWHDVIKSRSAAELLAEPQNLLPLRKAVEATPSADPPASEPSAAGVEPAPPARPRRNGRRGSDYFISSEWARTVLAMAASFLLAFGLLSWVSQWRQGGGTADGLAQPVIGATVAGTQRPAESQRPELPAVDREGPGPWKTVTVSMPDTATGATRQIRVPACERSSLDEQWLRSLPAPVPPEVVRAWQRAGYEVQQNRRFEQLRLDDGRPMVIPVDQVELRFIGNNAY